MPKSKSKRRNKQMTSTMTKHVHKRIESSKRLALTVKFNQLFLTDTVAMLKDGIKLEFKDD